MKGKMKRRRWIKVFCYEFLHKKFFRSLPVEQRFIWIALEVLAGECLFGKGQISITEDMGYSQVQIAVLLNVSEDLLKNTMKLLEDKKIIKHGENNVFFMTDFEHFQSEYLRQKHYRVGKNKPSKVTKKVVTPSDSNYSPSPSPSCSSSSGSGNSSNKYIYIRIIDYWNEQDDLRTIQKLTDKRDKALKQRVEDKFFMANWVNAIDKIVASDFLMGRTARNESHKNWKPDIDWFLKPDTIVKIMEGKYDNKPAGKDKLEF